MNYISMDQTYAIYTYVFFAPPQDLSDPSNYRLNRVFARHELSNKNVGFFYTVLTENGEKYDIYRDFQRFTDAFHTVNGWILPVFDAFLPVYGRIQPVTARRNGVF